MANMNDINGRDTDTHTDIAPKLSVVMSVYNGEDYVADAIESILAQTYRSFEFLIINDGSSDGSLAIIQDYAARDDRLRIIDQENTGLTVALCRGVDEARGAYIARMDADDLSLPRRFERQMALLEGNAHLVAATCDVEHFFDDGTISHVAKNRIDPRLLPLYNCFSNRIGGHGQVIFRRDAYDAAGGYDPSFRFAQDYDLWTRLTRFGGFGVVRETLYRFRTGHDSISKRSKSGQAENSLRTCMREFERLTGTPLPRELALAMRHFWWRIDPLETTVKDTRVFSVAMARAVTAFFAQNGDLRHLEYGVRRGMAARWRWRMKEIGAGHFAYRAVMIRNLLDWGVGALRSRARSGA